MGSVLTSHDVVSATTSQRAASLHFYTARGASLHIAVLRYVACAGIITRMLERPDTLFSPANRNASWVLRAHTDYNARTQLEQFRPGASPKPEHIIPAVGATTYNFLVRARR